MSALLPELLKAGLIEKLDGDDQRYEKMAKAAESLAVVFREKPALLIRAVLAGLDPDIPITDPLIQQARAALQAQWMTFTTAYPDEPVNLFRALLLEACHQSGEGRNAAILWGTAADTVTMLRLGKVEAVVVPWLNEVAFALEKSLLVQSVSEAEQTGTELDMEESQFVLAQVDHDSFASRISSCLSNTSYGHKVDANSLATHIAEELDGLANDVSENQAKLALHLSAHIEYQRQRIANLITAHESHRRTEQLRLDALWWSQALYSPRLNQSYRDLPPAIASVLMATDLLDLASLPTPASLGHLLAETVNHLAEAGYTTKRPLSEWLTELRGLRAKLPLGWGNKLIPPPAAGRISLRDVLVLTLGDKEWNVADCLNRAGIKEDYSINLPALAHALFRQEQAVRLAELAA